MKLAIPLAAHVHILRTLYLNVPIGDNAFHSRVSRPSPQDKMTNNLKMAKCFHTSLVWVYIKCSKIVGYEVGWSSPTLFISVTGE